MRTLAEKNMASTNRFREIRAFARTLPWPYNGMVNDILGSIQTGGNYLAALGLASYTEICGRQILFNGSNSEKDWKCFNEFLKYMGAEDVLERKLKYDGKKIYIKDAVRNGLVHRYFMKVGSGSVAMFSSDKMANQTGFLIQEPDKIIMVIVPYFNLFCNGLRKARDNNKLLWK